MSASESQSHTHHHPQKVSYLAGILCIPLLDGRLAHWHKGREESMPHAQTQLEGGWLRAGAHWLISGANEAQLVEEPITYLQVQASFPVDLGLFGDNPQLGPLI